MRNNLISVITIVIVSGFSLTCSGINKSKEFVARADSTLVVNADSSQELEDVADNGKSLNDIRFANFTEKDWLDNEYIRELRKYIDSFLKGNVKNEALEPYRGDVKGKFVIENLQPYLLGGLFIQIIFIDKPENIFTAWVYSDVDEEKEKVLDYSVRRLAIDEMKNDMTREQIFQMMKEHPELKLW